VGIHFLCKYTTFFLYLEIRPPFYDEMWFLQYENSAFEDSRTGTKKRAAPQGAALTRLLYSHDKVS
jgi:hypothetical protein